MITKEAFYSTAKAQNLNMQRQFKRLVKLTKSQTREKGTKDFDVLSLQ